MPSRQAFSFLPFPISIFLRRCESHPPRVAITLAGIQTGTSVAGPTDVVESPATARGGEVEAKSLTENVGF